MAGTSDQKEEMNWMYQGTSAIINPDDYLSGKKLDRNFELYATEVEKDAPSKIDLVVSKPAVKDVKMLDIDTIRKEDPLVAIKVREEKAKREIMDNPVRMKQLQSLILQAMEKKMKKQIKKEKKKKSKRNRSSSSDSSDRRRQSTERRHKRDNSSSRDRGRKSPDNKRRHHIEDRHRHRRERSRSEEKRRQSAVDKPSKRRRSSSSSSSSSDSDKRRKPHGYGLVHPKGIETQSKTKNDPQPSTRSKDEPKYTPKPAVVLPKPVVRSKMSEEERLQRLKEMEDNAKWRDSQRQKNVKRLETEEQQEEKELREHREKANFVKPLLAQAAETGSVEQRLKSNIYKIQRSHDAMHSSFITK